MQTWYNACQYFLVNSMKNWCQGKEYKIVIWNRHLNSFNITSHLHRYNRNSDVHMRIIHCRRYHLHKCNSNPTCIIRIKTVTHIFAAETVAYISAAETSNFIIATETATCIVARSTNVTVTEPNTSKPA